MNNYLRLDPGAMRQVAGDLDAATEASLRMGATVPTLADGYDLPPEIAGEAESELARVGADLRRSADAVRGLGSDVRARAVLAELADQAGEPGGLPGGMRDRLLRLVENFQCPLDDPVAKLLHEAGNAAAEGAKVGAGRLNEALTAIVDGRIAENLRETANEKLDQCQPPVELPEPPPPPPPPPPKPGIVDRVVNGARDTVEAIESAGRGLADALDDSRSNGPLPFGPPRRFPLPGP